MAGMNNKKQQQQQEWKRRRRRAKRRNQTAEEDEKRRVKWKNLPVSILFIFSQSHFWYQKVLFPSLSVPSLYIPSCAFILFNKILILLISMIFEPSFRDFLLLLLNKSNQSHTVFTDWRKKQAQPTAIPRVPLIASISFEFFLKHDIRKRERSILADSVYVFILLLHECINPFLLLSISSIFRSFNSNFHLSTWFILK